MRPQGELRQALAKAAVELAQQRGPCAWRDLAEHAQVGYTAAKRTVCNMVRAGELQIEGHEKRAHSRRWVALYGPSPAPGAQPADTSHLARVLRGWGG